MQAVRRQSVQPKETISNGEKAVYHDDADRRQNGEAVNEVLCEQTVRPVLIEQVQCNDEENSSIGDLGTVSGKMQENASGKGVATRNSLVRKYKKLARKPKINSSAIMDMSSSSQKMDVDVQSGSKRGACNSNFVVTKKVKIADDKVKQVFENLAAIAISCLC